MQPISYPTDDNIRRMSLREMLAQLHRLIALLDGVPRTNTACWRCKNKLVIIRRSYYQCWAVVIVGAVLVVMGIDFLFDDVVLGGVFMFIGLLCAATFYPVVLLYRWFLRRELLTLLQDARANCPQL